VIDLPNDKVLYTKFSPLSKTRSRFFEILTVGGVIADASS